MKMYRVKVLYTPETTYLILADSVDEAVDTIRSDWTLDLEEDDYEAGLWSDLTEKGVVYDSLKS